MPTSVPTSVPTTSSPYRVLEIGDSLGVDLGFALQRIWGAGTTVQVSADAVGDSGLANTGFYDWPATLAGDLSATHPQLVVVLLGANDMQSLAVGGADAPYGTTAWDQAYRARVAQISQEVAAAGADLLWVGEPAMQTPRLSAGMTHIDGIDAGVVGGQPWAAYLDPNPALSPAGGFATTGPTPATGAPTALRTPDGVHLTPAGAAVVALAAARAVATAFDVEVPATPAAG